jgi:hypothetical protein
MNQETIEQAADNVFNDFKSKNPIVPQKHILPFKLGYIEGAKWQAERMYSEEDIQAAIQFGKDIRSEKSFINHNFDSPYIDYEDSTLETKEWFEQFKKK